MQAVHEFTVLYTRCCILFNSFALRRHIKRKSYFQSHMGDGPRDQGGLPGRGGRRQVRPSVQAGEDPDHGISSRSPGLSKHFKLKLDLIAEVHRGGSDARRPVPDGVLAGDGGLHHAGGGQGRRRRIPKGDDMKYEVQANLVVYRVLR